MAARLRAVRGRQRRAAPGRLLVGCPRSRGCLKHGVLRAHGLPCGDVVVGGATGRAEGGTVLSHGCLSVPCRAGARLAGGGVRGECSGPASARLRGGRMRSGTPPCSSVPAKTQWLVRTRPGICAGLLSYLILGPFFAGFFPACLPWLT